ncbi:DUF2384 domain-containing protein [Neobacillus sp. YIM B02564]|uniref:DUF2384 domain-containing protein n=1 Tax=Neobacillus paridis TaxID=2803862 RepID=A0ABS1TV12_9BACI|nr:DUF2384 domain-containing protein [Neobacillus paridis]
MEKEKWAARDQNEVAVLLSQVRAMLSASGYANKIDAEKWLTAWLDTPNDALGGVKPWRLLEQMANESTMRLSAPRLAE